jgi:hypothetical protein
MKEIRHDYFVSEFTQTIAYLVDIWARSESINVKDWKYSIGNLVIDFSKSIDYVKILNSYQRLELYLRWPHRFRMYPFLQPRQLSLEECSWLEALEAASWSILQRS